MWNWITYLERKKQILIKIYDSGIVFDTFSEPFFCYEIESVFIQCVRVGIAHKPFIRTKFSQNGTKSWENFLRQT